MKEIRPEYEFPVEQRAWRQGAAPVAGVFFLDGDCHIVARHGPAAMELEERGALLIALVRFDAEGRERSRRDHPVRALGSREALARFAASAAGGIPPRPGLRHPGASFDG